MEASYDAYELINDEVKYVLNNPKDVKHRIPVEFEDLYQKNKNNLKEVLKERNQLSIFKDKIRDDLYNDQLFFDTHFKMFLDSIDIMINKITEENYDHLYIKANNIGWRNQSGYTFYDYCNDPQDFLSHILPDGDTTIEVKLIDNHIKMKVYHHDSPTGEFYYIYSVKNEFEKDFRQKLNQKINTAEEEQELEYYFNKIFTPSEIERKNNIELKKELLDYATEQNIEAFLSHHSLENLPDLHLI